MADPLSLEQFKALRAKGLSVDQIVRFEKGETPGQTQTESAPQMERQNIIGQTFNVPGATSRAAIRSNPALAMAGPFAGVAAMAGVGGPQAQQAAGEGALNPSNVQSFQDQAIQAGQNAFGGPSESVAVNFMKGLVPSAVGLVADTVTDPAQALLTILTGGFGKSAVQTAGKVPAGMRKILKIEDDLQKTGRAKNALDTVRNTLGKAVEISMNDAKDVPTAINFREIKSQRIWNALKNPVYEIELEKNGALKQTVGNMNKVKKAVGDLLTPQLRNEATKGEQRHIKRIEGMISYGMKKSARQAGKPIHEQMAGYSNFMKKYELVNETLENKKGTLLAERMKKTFEVGAEPAYKKAWGEVSKLSPEFRSVMKDQEKRVLLKKLLRKAGKYGMATGAAGGAFAGIKAVMD